MHNLTCLILCLGMFLIINVTPVAADDLFVPVPTRPMYYHEYLCTPASDLHPWVVSVYRDTGKYAADSAWNVSIGIPKKVHEITRTDNEFDADRQLRIERFTPDTGNDYLIIPVQVHNIGTDPLCFDIGRFTLTNNQTGIVYAIDDVMDFLCNPFQGGSIAPGEETKGSIAYQIPVELKGLDLSILLQDIEVTYLLSVPEDPEKGVSATGSSIAGDMDLYLREKDGI